MRMLLFTGGLLLFLFLVAPGQANATSLAGETIATTYLFPNTGTIFAAPQAIVVPGGLTNFANFANINFSANNILITTDRNAVVNNVAFDGFEFSDPSGVFATVSLDASTTYAGFNASRVTFNANQIFVNVEDLPGLVGQTISLDINSSSATAAPEPGTLVLFGSGLLSIAGLARRKILMRA